MAAVFDTLKYAETLKAAGLPEAEAKAHAQALAEALKEGTGELATRVDLLDVKRELTEIRGDIKLLRWMVGFALAMLVAVLWMLIRGAT